jgi:hypothetical protein
VKANVPNSKSGGTDRALQWREGSDRDRLGLELDSERMTVGQGGAVLIPPGVQHQAVGWMTILNVERSSFDPADESSD